MYDGTHPGTIVMNVIWTLFNMIDPRRGHGRGVGEPAAPPDGARGHDRARRCGARRRHRRAGRHGRPLQRRRHACNIDRSFTALPGESVKLVFPVLDGDATLAGNRGQRRRPQSARAVRSADPAGRRGAHDGALLARRHLAGLGRSARGRPSAQESGTHSAALHAWARHNR